MNYLNSLTNERSVSQLEGRNTNYTLGVCTRFKICIPYLLQPAYECTIELENKQKGRDSIHFPENFHRQKSTLRYFTNQRTLSSLEGTTYAFPFENGCIYRRSILT